MFRPAYGSTIALCAVALVPAVALAHAPIVDTATAGPFARIVKDVGRSRTAHSGGWRPIAGAPPRLEAILAVPLVRFREGRATLSNRAVARTTHAELGTSARRFTLDATRIRRSSAEARQANAARRDRSTLLAMDVGYEMLIGNGDTIRLAVTGGVEKRKPLIAIADGHWAGTSTRAVGIGWRNEDGLALNAGYFGIAPLRRLSAIERNVSLAAGSVIATHGLQAEAGVPLPLLIDRAARLGIRVATARIDERDRRALGTGLARDARTTLSLSVAFR